MGGTKPSFAKTAEAQKEVELLNFSWPKPERTILTTLLTGNKIAKIYISLLLKVMLLHLSIPEIQE